MKLRGIRTPAPALLALLITACGGDGQGFVARFSVGGSISGLTGNIELQLNGTDTRGYSGNGLFDFTLQLESDAEYTVTVLTQPAGQYCSIANGIGTINVTNITNVAVTCIARDDDLLAYDGFNYIFGQSLPGKNGGLGWNGGWRVVDGDSATDVGLGAALSGTITNGLNYTDGAGNRLVTTDGAWRTDATAFFGQGRRATSASFGGLGTERWISFLVRQAAPSAAPVTPTFNYVSGTPGTGYTFSPQVAMMGQVGLYNTGGVVGVGPFYGTATTTSALSGNVWSEGRVGLIVLRIAFNVAPAANDTMSLWFNPVLSLADPGTPTVSAAAANYDNVINGITMAWGDYRSFVIDEVRVGLDYESVTPYF